MRTKTCRADDERLRTWDREKISGVFLYQKASCRRTSRNTVRYDPFKLRNVPHDQWSRKLLEARIPILTVKPEFGRDLQRAVSNGKWIFAPHTRNHDRTKTLRGKFTVAERACTAYDGRGWKYSGIYHHTRCREDSIAWWSQLSSYPAGGESRTRLVITVMPRTSSVGGHRDMLIEL